MRYVSSDQDFKFWDFLVLFRFPQMGPRVIHYYRCQCLCPVFRLNWLSQNEIHCSWSSLRSNIHEIISLQSKNCKKFNFFQNQNNTCAHLFTLVMKFHDRHSSEQCIQKLINRNCLDKTRTRWNDFLFLISQMIAIFILKHAWMD